VNPNITPVEPRQDAAAEVERLRELVKRAWLPVLARKMTTLSKADRDYCDQWLRDAADTIGGEA
jgi:hypothetical protein